MLQTLLQATQELRIEQGDSVVTIGYADGSAYRLVADGKERKEVVRELGEVKVRARWADGTLEVQRRLPGGIKVTETFVRGVDSPRLVLRVRIEGATPQPVELTRAYDREGASGE